MKYPPTRYHNVYLTGAAHYLPGKPISNDEIDQYIAPINSQSGRIKNRILNDNGIQRRYYGINDKGETCISAAEMGQQAVQACLNDANKSLQEVTLLATGTSGADTLMPGFANMLQGKLHAPPMETRSHHGICGSGVAALKDAANLVDNHTHENAVVAAVEFPSRLFKRSRYTDLSQEIDFNAHFLRWMLSDGAGAACLSRTTSRHSELAIKLDWIHTKSFSGDYPVCMHMGSPESHDHRSFMDYPSFSAAEVDGSLALRQNIRLLPQLFEVGIHEYAELTREGWIDPEKIDHFLCHYSSEKLGTVCEELMQKAGLAIPRDRWFSNLKFCGNTGAASIFVMMSEFLATKELKTGDKIFCFVPESGRFTVSYFQFTVVSNETDTTEPTFDHIDAPHRPESSHNPRVQQLLQDLSTVWHDYRSKIWRTPIVQKISDNRFTEQDYLNWMACWIPQVREGSQWMRTAAENLTPDFQDLRSLILLHAGEEKNDFLILFEDYLASGGHTQDLDQLKRNPGGEALNGYMVQKANSANAFGLLGGIYIIEGTGQRIIPALLPLMRQQVDLPDKCFKFLDYHGENDINHLQRWLSAVEFVLGQAINAQADLIAKDILHTARQVASLYHMQWECVS